jgi:hypothetical protein
MSELALIVGSSGTGKSTSVRTLPPEKTFIVNVAGKPMPFKGWKSSYANVAFQKAGDKVSSTGNFFSGNEPAKTADFLAHIGSFRPEIKYIVIDDAQYLMSEEYMRRAKENGFAKFQDIAQNIWKIISTAKSLRDDLKIFFLWHPESEVDANGKRTIKAKTVGKAIDNYVTLEGMFTTVLFTEVTKEANGGLDYSFVTQTDGVTTAKSPMGMFETLKIPNDLFLVANKMDEYNN